eukprot:scaffold5874_cov29-Cyclotella_meneghiniana.AAC.3
MNTSKQVSFSPTSVLVLTPALPMSEHSKLWSSRKEISSYKVRWAKSIKHLQSMDSNIANHTDASDFMGLERFLSKDIQKQAEENRRHYIHSVIQAQHLYSYDDLAQFACSKSNESVARSHSVAMFYLKRHFQKSKFQESKGTSNCMNYKVDCVYLSTSDQQRKGSTALCA